MNNSVLISLITSLALLSACSNSKSIRTLDAMDIRQSTWASDDTFTEPRSEAEVKAAYDNYIAHSTEGDSSRLLAIHRLAEMEVARLNNLLKDDEDELDDATIRGSLERTRDLLQASLREFPDASNNDETLYQLARVLDQLRLGLESLETLQTLSTRHPQSRHYPEAQFRLAEAAFVRGDYLSAEDAYSQVLIFDSRRHFYERALFKRGWSRYKQGLYRDAIDDYLITIKNHAGSTAVTASGSGESDLDEYYRALGLTFASLQDLDLLQSYFADSPDEQYLYPIYRVISDSYLEQERYSDAAGLLRQFVERNPTSSDVPLAELQIVQIWRGGGFRSLFLDAIDSFYQAYQPDHSYWNDRGTEQKNLILADLREISMELASHYHERFSTSRAEADFGQARRWYQNYLAHFSSYARQDKIYLAYAELLVARQEKVQALHYFEQAAYDGDIILNKEAAYASIVLTSELYQEQPDNVDWLHKQVRYALLSAQLYPLEARYHTAALNAAEAAYRAHAFDAVLQLLDALPGNAEPGVLYQARVLQGLTYRETRQWQTAETVFSELLEQNLDNRQRQEQLDNLALVIYQQGLQEVEVGNEAAALAHYSRIAQLAPDSALAPTALYETILLAMNQQHWHQAIQAAEQFNLRHSKHELAPDAMRQASAAYLNAGDTARAAQAFEQLAAEDDSRDVQMAALWQAAELYESRADTDSAIRSYRRYAHTYPRPYPQYMEAMHRLSELYKTSGEADKRRFWQEKMVEAEQHAGKSEKTERSNYLAALASLDLGNHKARAFGQRQLIAPLAESLRIKRQLLQEGSTLLGRASTYGFSDVSTEATHAIGEMYQAFSQSLLNSERPPELRGEELLQYDILLEDQAFPFEEKAIEFYEMNLARVREGAGGKWIIESYQALGDLFPARYGRPGKVDIYGYE